LIVRDCPNVYGISFRDGYRYIAPSIRDEKISLLGDHAFGYIAYSGIVFVFLIRRKVDPKYWTVLGF
jgi:hypothetical protein